MKQMPFPDTNYGKQNKQKQTLKPIIIRPLMQTRWIEAGAYQLLEVITKLQTIFHPPGFFSISVSGMFGLTSNILVHTSDSSVDGLINKKRKEITLLPVLNLALSYDQWHSSLLPLSLAFHFIHLGYEYLAYIFHMQLVDGSCPEQEHADKFSTVSPFPRPLVSLDTTYEVNFTLSSLISAPISRCLCHIHRSSRDP